MNTTIAARLAPVTLLGAVFAGGFSVAAAHAGEAHTVRIVELPRVTIVAKRIKTEPLAADVGAAAPKATVRIVELPRVLVVAKRAVPSTTFVAEQRNTGSPGV